MSQINVATLNKQSGGKRLRTRGEKIFGVFNSVLLVGLGLICFIPFWYVICLSFSNANAVLGGRVKLVPIGFNLSAYQYVLERGAFWKSIVVSFSRVALGVPISLFLVIMSSYPLSKESGSFRLRTVYVWVFFVTMLFNGGLIPNYLLIMNMKMLNSIWALVLPGALNVFNVVLMLNFFRQIPSELEDAAFVDGAGHWRILWQIFVPISIPSIATITLFTMVGHWNAWFDGLIYMKKPELYPLQTYLRTIIFNMDFKNLSATEIERLSKLNDRSVKASQIVIGALPILMVYPFLQKYFVSGLTLGSVKG